MWADLEDTALLVGSDLVVILNPESGPGAGPIDPNYIGVSGTGPLVDVDNAGATIIGYVRTDYTNIGLAEVRSEVDRYFDPAYWRGAGVRIDGIFFDEMSNDLADVGYYQDLRDHVRSYGAGFRVVGNPGTSFVNNPSGQSTWTIADYVATADTLMVFESDADEYLASYMPPSWVAQYSADHFAHVVYAQATGSGMLADVSRAITRNAGYVYLTSDVLVNPYDVLPDYWFQEVEASIGLVFADGFEDGNTSRWSP